MLSIEERQDAVGSARYLDVVDVPVEAEMFLVFSKRDQRPDKQSNAATSEARAPAWSVVLRGLRPSRADFLYVCRPVPNRRRMGYDGREIWS